MGKLRALAAGAIGGLAGAALMGPVHNMASKFNGRRPLLNDDPTVKVANIVTATVTGRRLRYSNRKTGGAVVHFAFAAGVGALYALLADEYPAVCAGGGTLMASAVYGGAHAVTVPALGLAPSPLKSGPAAEGAEFAAHLVYGLVTEAVRRVLA